MDAPLGTRLGHTPRKKEGANQAIRAFLSSTAQLTSRILSRTHNNRRKGSMLRWLPSPLLHS